MTKHQEWRYVHVPLWSLHVVRELNGYHVNLPAFCHCNNSKWPQYICDLIGVFINITQSIHALQMQRFLGFKTLSFFFLSGSLDWWMDFPLQPRAFIYFSTEQKSARVLWHLIEIGTSSQQTALAGLQALRALKASFLCLLLTQKQLCSGSQILNWSLLRSEVDFHGFLLGKTNKWDLQHESQWLDQRLCLI